jgi:uncharacterized protein
VLTLEFLRVFLFLAAVAIVYVAAGHILLRRFVAVPRRPVGRAGRVVLAVAGVGILCGLYGRFLEPRWVEVTTTRVPTSRLPAGHRGVRIVHLSDIHSDPSQRVEERLPAIVAAARPDLVVFTGDAANSADGVPVFRRCLTEIAKIAPTFVVKGNWDVWFFTDVDRFSATGAVELDGTSAGLVVDGAPIHVLGTAFDRPEGIDDALAALPPDGPAIALYHCPYPDVVAQANVRRLDLFLAGHVHGGQVALPYYGALVTLSKFGKRFERGLYPDADGFGFPMYVSRGIGMEGGRAPRVRFCARPEVALIELVSAP